MKKSPLRRHPNLIPLSRDHHHGLVLAQLLKYDVPDYQGMPTTVEGKAEYALRFYHDKLGPHFRREEEQLLPVVTGYDALLDRYCEQVREDHRRLSRTLDNWSQTPPNGADLDDFARLLSEHIRFEERILFQRIQEVAPASVLENLRLENEEP